MGSRLSSSKEPEPEPKRVLSIKHLDFKDLTFSNKENVILIWFDENIDVYDDTLETKTLLQITNYYVLFYADKESCVRSIKLIKHAKIILVVSGKCARDILEQVHSYKKIDSIFIFCYRSKQYNCLRRQFSKIVNIHINHHELFKDLNRTIKQLRSQLETFSLFNPKTRLRHLTSTSADFFWFLLLKQALMNLPMTETSKQNIINQSRSYYRHNQVQQRNIDKFEKTYCSNDAIKWYTRPSFISHLVAKALRTEDIDLLYLFRFFIIDLSKAIQSLAVEQSSKYHEILRLYRGLTLSADEIDKIRSNIGNHLSPNGFMSATRCSKVASVYGTNVRFEIEVDNRLNICADIENESAIADEKEVLFDLGSVFRIKDVYYSKAIHRWVIKITAEPIGEQLITEVLQLNNTDRPEIFFGELIYLTEHYNQAKRYFSRLKQEFSKQSCKPINEEEFLKVKTTYNQYIRRISNKQLIDSTSVLVMIADVYQMTGNHNKAMQHLQTALDALANTLS